MHTVKYLQKIGERKSKSLARLTKSLTRVIKSLEQRAMIGVAMGGCVDEGGGEGGGEGAEEELGVAKEEEHEGEGEVEEQYDFGYSCQTSPTRQECR